MSDHESNPLTAAESPKSQIHTADSQASDAPKKKSGQKEKLKRDPSTGRFAGKPGGGKGEKIDYLTMLSEHSQSLKTECKSYVDELFQKRLEEKRVIKEKALKYARQMPVQHPPAPVIMSMAPISNPIPPMKPKEEENEKAPVKATKASWYKNQIFS